MILCGQVFLVKDTVVAFDTMDSIHLTPIMPKNLTLPHKITFTKNNIL